MANLHAESDKAQLNFASNLLVTGVVMGFLSVVIGAFSAHGLKSVLSPYALNIVETGAKYQMYHGIAILVTGLSFFLPGLEVKWLKRAGVCFVLGIILFSGSLYLLAASAIKWLGMITPLGGFLMLIGWAFLGFSFFQLGTSK